MRYTQTMKPSVNIEDPGLVVLACELHDGPCQHLTSALWHLDTFRRLRGPEPEKAEKEFNDGFAALRRGVEDLRTLLRDLRPMQLEGVGLIQSIEALIQENVVRHGLLVSFFHTPDIIELPPVLKTAVFRIIQEGLANVRRHSRSRTARLEVICHDNLIRLEIEDWGAGFDPTNVGRECFGIAGMRARTALLGGTMTVTSRPQNGTLLVIEIPLAQGENGKSPSTAEAQSPHSDLLSPRTE
jgi:two-component system, NarL family, sensor histidine kinase DegS